jgi:hypothetical protein
MDDLAQGIQESQQLTQAITQVIEWLTDNNAHTLAALLEWNAGDLIEWHTDTPSRDYDPDVMIKAYKAAQLVIYGTQ